MTAIRTMTTHVLLASALFVLAAGCSPNPNTGADERDEAVDAAVLTPQERAERREQLSRKWQEARTRLEELRSKANADGIQNEWDEAVAKIDREAVELDRELEEFEEDSRQAWDAFEARVQRSLDAIGQEIDEAVAPATP